VIWKFDHLEEGRFLQFCVEIRILWLCYIQVTIAITMIIVLLFLSNNM